MLAAALVIGFGLGSSNPTLVATAASPSPTLTATASLTASATQTPLPTPQPTPTPTCDLPPSLPPPPATVATPAVSSSVSLLFESPYYTGTGPAMAPRGTAVWFQAAGTATPRLLAGMDNLGGVEGTVPLALSADARTAAVWWQPRQYAENEPPCPVGIYLVSTTSGSSRLVVSDAWAGWAVSAYPRPDECANPIDQVANRLRGVGFSADGRWLAVVECSRIRLFGLDASAPDIEHIGVCDQWAWSPAGSPTLQFVASCEDMTSAWLAEPGNGNSTHSSALPLPSGGYGWGNPSPEARGIGLTSGGTIRIVRFFGAAIGCESPDCSLPPLRYAVTTMEPWDAQAAPVVRSGTIGFLVTSTRLWPDAGWAYVEVDASAPRVVDLRTGRIVAVTSTGDPAGTPAAGTRVFGSSFAPSGERIVWSMDGSGARREIAKIAWPASLPPDFGGETTVTVTQLQVASPS